MRLLLISNSASPGETYLEKPAEDIAKFLGEVKENVVFIPFAGVTFTFDAYVEKVNKALAPVGVKVKGVHTFPDPVKAVKEAGAIMVGGGNTFQLTKMMQEQGLIEAIRERVLDGAPYVGWSAGSNVACPTIRTTNDMPIVEPQSFNVLNLVPFQINPHYLDSHPENHGGETREVRILEFIEANPDMYVAGLREGCRFLVEDGKLELIGDKSLRVFKKGEDIKEYEPGANLQFLIK
ncbi:dipeptidase PepE [Porphyromonas levii]|uniref:dipeptidase E n=1 Tax=Porphyromonas levii TaxID=28114 RepID=A0A4Y8WRE2_9PORP|nr:dipeptidase PepE [Porphyromonas levii]MBR8713277.1 Peptidase E [Porphyromonas levii]MBR8715313.1 Peptidase E [Porphyromonas levii]MBR8727839.1 Peptidase E [Porphyromonas levii]MBR8731067.1 Peptidase E [Porphyromonas levii]MBR8736183.1 Peptidase E [Porphyromonas levii]